VCHPIAAASLPAGQLDALEKAVSLPSTQTVRRKAYRRLPGVGFAFYPALQQVAFFRFALTGEFTQSLSREIWHGFGHVPWRDRRRADAGSLVCPGEEAPCA